MRSRWRKRSRGITYIGPYACTPVTQRNPTVASSSRGGIAFHHPAAFWLGVAAVTVGVVLHLPMYVESAGMHYRMAGMPVDTPMMAGMGLIIIGLAATFYGLYPRTADSPTHAPGQKMGTK